MQRMVLWETRERRASAAANRNAEQRGKLGERTKRRGVAPRRISEDQRVSRVDQQLGYLFDISVSGGGFRRGAVLPRAFGRRPLLQHDFEWRVEIHRAPRVALCEFAGAHDVFVKR